MTAVTSAPTIPSALVRQHIDRLVRGMADAGADGLLVFRDTNILGFCGVSLKPSDRLICGLVNRDGKIAFVVPALEAALASHLPPGSLIVRWQEHDDAYAAVARAAQLLGIASGLILLDGYMWLDARERLSGAMNGATLRRDGAVLDQVRLVKSPEEIAAIRAACDDTGRAYPLVESLLRPGMTEADLASAVGSRMRQLGCTPWGELIQGGENASIPHHPTSSRPFAAGDVIVVDYACKRDGYLADMTRTFGLGPPTPDAVHAYQVVRNAQRAAIDAVRPGVTCDAIDAAARQVIADAGLGDYFIHRTGHGIGLDIHEPPFIVRGNSMVLEAGGIL